ncbi:alkaline phosphatase PhoX [Glaciecola sp. 1036]|uniref:alkaline phosphatase PhoX n=1 Tax=Alteromonadaceae TaxID=72275 RepID=UPI003CFFF084
MTITRRNFNKGMLAIALSGLATHLTSAEKKVLNTKVAKLFTAEYLIPDPKGMLDLPEGFSYQIISQLGNSMSDGFTVPDSADGMGCFKLDDDRVILVRNHELKHDKGIKVESAKIDVTNLQAYDHYSDASPLPGGTSNIVYNLKTQKVEKEYMSLLGTIRNCAGGKTPWNAWLTCEESVATPSDLINKEHGYVFEVPSQANGLVEPKPIVDMGRFNHEAACIDPKTGIVYLTEDRWDSLLYRFIPNEKTNLHAGGTLQALAIKGKAKFDTRNWEQVQMQPDTDYTCEWITLDNVKSPEDDLRLRGHEQGAALFARGEGIYFSDDPDKSELYFCCTSGGNKKLGQIMRYLPSTDEGTDKEQDNPGVLQLFVESDSPSSLNFGDNLVITPSGHLIVCEDQYLDEVHNNLKLVTPSGQLFDFARVRWQTEPAGACFSPDGSVMFVNLYSPTRTVAITGPWHIFDELS